MTSRIPEATETFALVFDYVDALISNKSDNLSYLFDKHICLEKIVNDREVCAKGRSSVKQLLEIIDFSEVRWKAPAVFAYKFNKSNPYMPCIKMLLIIGQGNEVLHLEGSEEIGVTLTSENQAIHNIKAIYLEKPFTECALAYKCSAYRVFQIATFFFANCVLLQSEDVYMLFHPAIEFTSIFRENNQIYTRTAQGEIETQSMCQALYFGYAQAVIPYRVLFRFEPEQPYSATISYRIQADRKSRSEIKRLNLHGNFTVKLHREDNRLLIKKLDIFMAVK